MQGQIGSSSRPLLPRHCHPMCISPSGRRRRQVLHLRLRPKADGISEVATETLNVLHGLLTAIPTFWGPAELTQVSKLYIDHYASSEVPLTPLMKTVAKRAPTAVLIKALADMWPSLQATPHTVRFPRGCVMVILIFRVGSSGRLFRPSQTMFARRIAACSSGEHPSVV